MASKRKLPTVRQIINRDLRRGLTNSDILANVRKAHPHSEITLPSINYLRNQLRADDPKIPTELVARQGR